MRVRVPCPAKVNLFLSVGARDERGYHPIRTVFQAVSLFDELHIEPSGTGTDTLISDWPEMPEDNTVARALRWVREIADVPPLRVEIRKSIPAQAGLGGGSSDAAGLLRAIPLLSAKPVPNIELLEVARAVGADVPFFLVGGRARGEGYGEVLTPMPDSEPLAVVLAMPPVRCSTAEAYRQLDSLPRSHQSWPNNGFGKNDFEAVAPQICLDLVSVLKEQGARWAALSGSGAAVFGFFPSQQRATDSAAALCDRGQDLMVWTVETLGRQASLTVSPF